MSRPAKQYDMFRAPPVKIDIPTGWTLENYQAARQCWLDGDTQSEIGRKFGVSKHTINGIAHRFGWPARGSPIIYSAAVEAAPLPDDRPPLPAGHPLTWGLICPGYAFTGAKR